MYFEVLRWFIRGGYFVICLRIVDAYFVIYLSSVDAYFVIY